MNERNIYARTLMQLILISCISVPAISQSFHGGMLLGLTTSQVDGDSYAGYNKAGIQGGVFVNTVFGTHTGALLEIKYANRGARKPVSSGDPEVYVLNLHYIDLPVMFNLILWERFIMEAGLVPGYLFAAAGEDSGGRLSKDQLAGFHKFDLGSLLGLRLKINDRLSFSARYSYSLLSIRDIDTAGAYYSWFGNLFGYRKGDYNNYLSFGLYYEIR